MIGEALLIISLKIWDQDLKVFRWIELITTKATLLKIADGQIPELRMEIGNLLGFLPTVESLNVSLRGLERLEYIEIQSK